jgi:MFS family permease
VQRQQKRENAIDPVTVKSRRMGIVTMMLLYWGTLWIYGQISGLQIEKAHGALTTYSLISSGVNIFQGVCCLTAGLLALRRQRRIAAWMLLLAAFLALTTAVLGLVNPAWEGNPPVVAWTNAGMSLGFALVFILTSRWLSWQEEN